ncbi:hypothetical protein [Methylobacter luteus]|uniref:hypothetical protein n=1 Tax=Methylobacter luteus TaxID=415 RepID=UPI00048116CC|nr:hypothetical protein [Methylobacter luteus]
MDNQSINQASKKRLLLSWYLDFLFFMTLWVLLSYFLGLDESMPFWEPYVVFVVIRLITSKFIGSIGYTFLSINKDDMSVNNDILIKENWLTILLGVLLVLEGTKQLVRWTQMFVSQPAFGFFPDETTQIVIHLAFGVFFILAGYWFLKLDVKGIIVGIGVALLNLVSDVLSWKLWDPVVEQMVLKRREVQGLPVREGEIEMMQSFMPEGMVVVATIGIIAMAITYPRFKNA